ncbi:MAG: DUF4124 domain-containing protein [Porticoccus sp.]|jgi:hypothetical protein|uniref:DUF4124 domain-containing protein n=1 Tax=Porticoccus hydrocarbonoclasticus TaxID=1073414 RepID=UPI000569351A|nr:DUF4124 domain-containing protein [Porticoccus hydrocarbonoclasticus]MBG57158.1 DUF4124 domain-containing protein [Porticoccus sp.]|tara:strand:- start:1141 stop:1650 length:510 start_codon:yes stop_codon:yes gene_type:complete
MRITGTGQAALIILAMLACQAQGQQIVYKSVDINGNVVYSDAPLENAVLVETITLPDAAGKDGVQNDADARIEQMANTTERLQQDREKRTQARREAEEALIPEQLTTPPVIYREEHYYNNYYPHYNRHPYRPFWQKPRRYPPRYRSGERYNNDTLLVPKSKLLTPSPHQ